MTLSIQLGSKVRLQHDDGWGSPGCVMSQVRDRVRVYWPDENMFTVEFPTDLVPYGIDISRQPCEAAA